MFDRIFYVYEHHFSILRQPPYSLTFSEHMKLEHIFWSHDEHSLHVMCAPSATARYFFLPPSKPNIRNNPSERDAHCNHNYSHIPIDTHVKGKHKG